MQGVVLSESSCGLWDPVFLFLDDERLHVRP